MADLEAYHREVAQWTGRDKSISKAGAQTRFNCLNNELILQLLTEQPEFQKKLVVDQSISSSKSSSHGRRNQASTHLVGSFSCECKKKKKKKKKREDEPQRRDWSSGKVFTEIFVTSGERECKFDVVVWSQQCTNCRAKVSSDIDEETYRERVFSKMLLLLGLRSAIARDHDRDEKKTAPHLKSLCCACKAGKCLEGGRGY